MTMYLTASQASDVARSLRSQVATLRREADALEATAEHIEKAIDWQPEWRQRQRKRKAKPEEA